MKLYHSLGELLHDYRKDTSITQANFAANLNIDIRTVQRWENDETLIKSEKEKDIVLETLLPYQLIRNLNAAVPISTFYDFRLRKYSLTKLNNELPDATWLKARINDFTKRIKTIENELDINHIIKDIKNEFQKHTPKPINKNLIQEATKLLPELNLIIKDDSGYYAGHSIVFPINSSTFEKLKNREISEDEIKLKDLVNYKTQKNPIFYNFDITADCNDNIFYIAHHYFNFFLSLQNKDYEYCSFTIRHDSIKLNKQFGLHIAWEDKEMQKARGLEAPPRFYVGNFKEFLSNS